MEWVELLVAVVPAPWWPVIDRALVVALVGTLLAAVIVKGIETLDLRDARRDWPVIGVVAPWFGLVLELGQTVIEMFGVKLPGVHSLAKFKELWVRARTLLGAPHVDDGAIDKSKA